ncbi:MAG: hypothetical protein AAGC55_04275, partial [Myxococcota bacterium]
RSDQPLDELLDQIARGLYTDLTVRPLRPAEGVDRAADGALVAGSDRSSSTPVYKRWWFWTGLTALAAAAIAVPLVLSSGGGETSCPDGQVCGAVIWSF